MCPTEDPIPACLVLGLCWFSGRELGCLCPPDLPLLQCSQWVVQCGERGPRSLPRPWGGAGPQPLATSQQHWPERYEGGCWVCLLWSMSGIFLGGILGLMTLRSAADPENPCCVFGSILPLPRLPACERTRCGQAMAERRLVLLRSLLSSGSQPHAWDNPNCPSSSPRSIWPS